jgi:SagB-type dehydrogenase family enzyme
MTTPQFWQHLVLSPGKEDHLWEVFHENSKARRLTPGLHDEMVVERMKDLQESLRFSGYPATPLPPPLTRLSLPLAKAITSRMSSRTLCPCRITLRNLATLLHYAYGIRHGQATSSPRRFRVVPSAGALYPLELFFHSVRIPGLPGGLYHYSPAENNVRWLHSHNAEALAGAMVDPTQVEGAALLIFITAIFERSIFKYGDRGYRFILLEAGHVAQNLNVVANSLGLGNCNIGGFYDEEVDSFLRVDGVTHSTMYIIALGKKKD